LSAIANQSAGYTSVSLKNVGDAVAGRIVGFEDYQVTDWQTKELKFFKSGDPIMATRVHLETDPGNESSRVTLYAEKANMKKAIGTAFRAAGRSDLVIGDDLAVTFSGFDGRAHAFQADYSAAESE
jgi:hypothetical protein